MENEKDSAVNKPTSIASPLAGKHIIIVLGCFILGGAERQAILLAKWLAKEHAAKVQIWGLFDPGEAIELCEALGIPWKIVPPKFGRRRLTRWPKAIFHFSRLLRKERPDVLLPYTWDCNVLCGLSWRLAGAKTCVWNQRDEGRGLSPTSRAVQWAIRRTPAFVSNSQIGADYIKENFAVPQEKFTIVHNGVDLAPAADTRDTWRRRLGISESCFVACMVANIPYYKEHKTLLRAWKLAIGEMQSQGREAVLLLAGRLDQGAEEVKALAFDLNLGSGVRFLGMVRDITGLLSAVDLGVFSSKFEGCPNGVLECMASGLAVVGTDIPGIREAVGFNGEGWLAPSDDPDTLAKQIIELANNPEKRSALGTANRQRILTEFQTDKMIKEMVRIISKNLGHP